MNYFETDAGKIFLERMPRLAASLQAVLTKKPSEWPEDVLLAYAPGQNFCGKILSDLLAPACIAATHHTEEWHRLNQQALDAAAQLQDKLSPALQREFIDYSDLLTAVYAHEEEMHFETGFCLAFQIIFSGLFPLSSRDRK